jgi:uncharacterized protein (DUF2225 family)
MSSDNNENIFAGLEHLGFNETGDLNLYGTQKSNIQEKKTTDTNQTEEEKQKSLLFDRELICPVCENSFKARSVKTSAARMQKKESDFFIRYSVINPYFYDVWVCNICGYATMKIDFEKIRAHQIEKVQKNISQKWKGITYPEVYDLNIAIERYKLALLNYCVMEARSSSKAMTCLKLAWMYRLAEDFENEVVFLKQALEGFNDAFYNEDFPIYGMDRFTTMYLLGELNRRTTNFDQANLWFSKIITGASIPQRIKELARDQKDLIKEAEDAKKAAEAEVAAENEENEEKPEKKGFFSRFFK